MAGVERENDEALPYLRPIEVKSEKKTITASMAIHKRMKNGTVQEQVITIRAGDDLEEKAARAEYRGYRVDETNPSNKVVRFENEVEIRKDQILGADRADIFEAQIRYSIEEHFRKQRKLRPQGIRDLSLFFIDRVG